MLQFCASYDAVPNHRSLNKSHIWYPLCRSVESAMSIEQRQTYTSVQMGGWTAVWKNPGGDVQIGASARDLLWKFVHARHTYSIVSDGIGPKWTQTSRTGIAAANGRTALQDACFLYFRFGIVKPLWVGGLSKWGLRGQGVSGEGTYVQIVSFFREMLADSRSDLTCSRIAHRVVMYGCP